jgi:plasmid stabilization system protein ParE
MMRFSFTPDAESDIDEITRYLQDLPQEPALCIGRSLQRAIYAIARFPGLGRVDERLTRQAKCKIRRFVSGQYILFYYIAEQSIRIIGVLPGKRDIDGIMRRRMK